MTVDALRAVSDKTDPRRGDKRPISSMCLSRTVPADISSALPCLDWVSPNNLFIDSAYQRDPSPRSVALIHQIVAGWDWRKFKPPIVARTENGLEVIDGQHTAIAAASHPKIDSIPIMIIEADEQSGRATAFISHNKDRVPITRLQMHRAAAVAGDPAALDLEETCRRANVTLLNGPPTNGAYQPGETIAVAALQKLLARQGTENTLQILNILVDAGERPVSAEAMRAVEMLLYHEDFIGKIEPHETSELLRSFGKSIKPEAKLFASTHHIPNWKAFGILVFKKRRKTQGTKSPDNGAVSVANHGGENYL